MNVTRGIELHHDGDLPARSGLGSSSAFTVGLLQSLYGLNGKICSKKRLSLEAIHVEQNMIKESVGSQDQVAVAFGGFNKITFQGDQRIEVTPMTIGKERLDFLQDHLMMFFTGTTRFATDIEKEKISNLPQKSDILKGLSNLTESAIDVLNGDGDLLDFGRLLHEGWTLKKSLSDQVSNPFIDDIYETAIKNGAIGGKLLGAGAGGFILFFVENGDKKRLRAALSHLLHVPFRFENLGSQVIYYRETGV
ncbi:MAG TPA: GHMP family kinase ATP-binding protein [Candidatus Brocadiaceae bacterium]